MEEKSFPDVAGVEEAAVVVVLAEVDVVGAAVVVLGLVEVVAIVVVLVADVIGAAEVVVDAVDTADVVALVVVAADDTLVVADIAVVLLPFPPHPIRSIATITRVREIPKILLKFHSSISCIWISGSFRAPESRYCNTSWTKSTRHIPIHHKYHL